MIKSIPAKQRHLDDEERFQIAHLYALGRSPTSIAAEIGRDKGTVLSAVRNDEKVIVMVDEQRETLAELFESTAIRALTAITEEKLEKSSARDLGVLAGISTEKFRLLTGESTQSVAMVVATAAQDAWTAILDEN